MKKFNLITLLLFAVLSTSLAQDMRVQPLERGTFLFGTGIGFSTSSADIEVSGTSAEEAPNTVSTQFNFSPRLGYFFTRNLVGGIGMQALASRVDTEGGADGDFNDARTLFGPFARFYFPIGSNQAFYLGLVTGFGGSTSSVSVEGVTQSVDNSVTAIGFGPGYTIFANNNVSLETQLQYNFGRSTNDIEVGGVNTETTTQTNAFDISVGVNYYFSRTK